MAKDTKIKKLTPEVINKIAAGEVVERPSSVIKELLENSLDSGASVIQVHIEDGGRKLISVQDNGTGMSKEDLLLSVEPHTTSKISQLEDLFEINSFGFRGEALSSIASVSKLTIKSKQNEELGYEVTIEGSRQINQKESVLPEGTIVEVKELFFNVPARRKFLKSDQTELRNIVDVITSIAVVNSNVTFRVFNNGRLLFQTHAENSTEADFISEERVKTIYGFSEDSEFVSIFFEGSGISVTGFVGHPSISTNERRMQHVFVNKRPVNDKIISKAVRDGFDTFIPKDKQPIFIINIKIKGDLVDVNVHPRKSEVKFKDSGVVFAAVKRAVKEALKKYFDFIDEAKPTIGEVDTYEEKNIMAIQRLRDSAARNADSEESYASDPENSDFAKKFGGRESFSQKSGVTVTPRRDEVAKSMEFTKALLASPEGSSTSLPTNMHQFHNRYIVVEAPGEIQIWDQHAAAERIRYEKLLNQYKSSGIEVQKILTAEVVKVSKSEMLLLSEFSEFLHKLGFELEPFGENEIMVRSIPSLLVEANFSKLLLDLFGLISEMAGTSLEKNLLTEKYERFIKTMACHSSVVANQKMNTQEMQHFIEELKKCENPYSCPHGRPIIWRIKTSEIDKHFNR